MLGTITEQTSQRLMMERRYDLDHDLFLRDHTLGNAPSASDPSLTGLAVIPFTFSMELVAQLAMRLSGRSDRVVVSIEHSRGSRWLSLDDLSVTLRMVAEASASNADAIPLRTRSEERRDGQTSVSKCR